MRHAPVTMCLVVVLSGCFPVYSPPIRGFGGGMPDRVAKDQLELGGNAAGWRTAPTTGGPRMAYGLSDTLILEAGGNLNFFEGLWATVWGGARVLRKWRLTDDFTFSSGFEFGAGAGIGGRASTTRRWTDLGTAGVYDGVSIGLRYRFLGAFLRGRVDGTVNTHAPMTLWATIAGGLEGVIAQRVIVTLAGGSVVVSNQPTLFSTWFYEAGLSILLGEIPQKSP